MKSSAIAILNLPPDIVLF